MDVHPRDVQLRVEVGQRYGQVWDRSAFAWLLRVWSPEAEDHLYLFLSKVCIGSSIGRHRTVKAYRPNASLKLARKTAAGTPSFFLLRIWQTGWQTRLRALFGPAAVQAVQIVDEHVVADHLVEEIVGIGHVELDLKCGLLVRGDLANGTAGTIVS